MAELKKLIAKSNIGALSTSKNIEGVFFNAFTSKRHACHNCPVTYEGVHSDSHTSVDLVNGDCFGFGSSSYAAVAGYPLVTVPMGFVFNLPVGITFAGTAWSEALLIGLAHDYEQASRARVPPPRAAGGR